MSYLNGQIGYRDDLLQTRSVIKKNNWVLLEPDGIVKNVVPGYENCDVTILGSPAMGASFADYLVTVNEGGKNTGIGGEGIESFLYVMSGTVTVKNDDTEVELTEGGYIYSPAGNNITFEGNAAKLYVYRRRYEALAGYDVPSTVIGNVNEMEWIEYEGMSNCHIKDLLPKDLRFDMNMHILKFKLGASHGYIETHIQEHGMLFLSGKGVYRLDDEWVPCQEGDYVFLDAYCPQACYAVGDEGDFSYIYSKDCNRDVQL
ncbi:MAG: (S)-ureidoglycine aminohydrolase [Dorea sp.]|nr:(S)-ureidoglycine aminohydrolase [Dorea sp.]